jgi:hypothetical protein
MLYRIPNLSPEYLRVIEGLNEMRLRLRFLLQPAADPLGWTIATVAVCAGDPGIQFD